MSFSVRRLSFLVCVSGIVAPVSLEAGCCDGRSALSASDGGVSSASAHGTLQAAFGGSAGPSRIRLVNTGSKSVTYQIAGQSVQVPGQVGNVPGSATKDFGGTDPQMGNLPPMPGEKVTPQITSSGSGGGANGSTTAEEIDDKTCEKPISTSGNTEANTDDKTTTPNPGAGETGSAPPVQRPGDSSIPGGGGGGGGEEEEPPRDGGRHATSDVMPYRPTAQDLKDFGRGAATVAPGGLRPAPAGSSGPPFVIQKPNLVVAVSLGDGPGQGDSRLGFIVPQPIAGSTKFVFWDIDAY
jgi:hypothetical protein